MLHQRQLRFSLTTYTFSLVFLCRNKKSILNLQPFLLLCPGRKKSWKYFKMCAHACVCVCVCAKTLFPHTFFGEFSSMAITPVLCFGGWIWWLKKQKKKNRQRLPFLQLPYPSLRLFPQVTSQTSSLPFLFSVSHQNDPADTNLFLQYAFFTSPFWHMALKSNHEIWDS